MKITTYEEYAEFALKHGFYSSKAEAMKNLKKFIKIFQLFFEEKGEELSIKKFGRFRKFKIKNYKVNTKIIPGPEKNIEVHKITFKPSDNLKKNINKK